MNRKIHVRKGSIPAWRPPEDPDTACHAGVRITLYAILVLTYVSLSIGSFAGAIDLSWANSVLLGYFFLLGLPAIHYGVRPGKGKVWLIALGIMILLVRIPYLILAIPLSMLAAQMWKSIHP